MSKKARALRSRYAASRTSSLAGITFAEPEPGSERTDEVAPRPGADERLLWLSVREENHRRNGEHFVPRRDLRIVVDIDAGDFGLLDRRVVDVLNALPEKQRFLRGLRAGAGFRQIGVPYVRPERAFGRSTNNFLRNLGWARRAILSFSYAPLDFIAWLAFVTVGASVVAR